MPRIRPELKRGIALLGLFIILMVSSDLLFPYSIQKSQYIAVSIEDIKANPSLFEGESVSTTATIISVSSSGSNFIAQIEEDAYLTFQSPIGSPQEGDRVYVRGISWIQTNDTIIVHEFYVLDYSSSIIRSIPGIILFIALFL